METSDYYLVLEKMIRKGDVISSDLERLLDTLEEQEHISAEEHQSLLQLAQELNTN